MALLALAQIVDTAVLMPNTPDHQYLAALVNLGLLAAFVGHRPASSAALVLRVAPTARWVLLVAYGAAVVAKYNSDFLAVSRSCAAVVAHNASFGAIPTESLPAHGFVLGTIVGETLVFTLLLIRRTRAWGVVVGIGFHYLVSLSPAISVGDFTTNLWALFLLFLSSTTRASLEDRIRREWRQTSVSWLFSKIPRTITMAVLLFAVGWTALAHTRSVVAVWLIVTLLGPWLIYVLVTTLRHADHPRSATLSRPPVAHALSLVLVALLVVSPYVGLGTSSRFTMFSSLRTEGPGTNHLFMPSFNVFHDQNDYLMVERVSGPSGALDGALKNQAAMPTVEVRRVLADRSVGGVFTTTDGDRVEVSPHEDHELRAQAPWWQRKTQHYRTFRVPGVTVDEFCSN